MFRSLHDMPEEAGLPLGKGQAVDQVPTAGANAIRLPEVANLSAER